MLKHLFRKSIIIGLIFFSFPFFGNLTQASELKYTKIIDLKNNQILFSYGGLEQTNFFLCQTTDLSCQNLGSTTPPQISDFFTDPKPLGAKIKNVKFDRKNATRLTLSPDEKWLVYYDAALANKEGSRKFVLVALENGVKKKTYELSGKVNYWDLLSEDLRIFYFSPDSTKLVYLDDRSGYPSLYSVNLTGVPPTSGRLPGRQITQKKYTIADFLMWDANTIYFSANRESDHLWSLYRYDLKTSDVKKIASDISYSQRMHKVDEQLLFLQIKNNSTIPALHNPKLETISYFPSFPANPAIIGYTEKEIKLGQPGQRKLGGVLMQPANYSPAKSYPLFIWLHGGPYRQVGPGYHSYPR